MLESRCGLLAPRDESGPKTAIENSSSQTTADGSDTAWQDAQHNRPAGQCGGFRIGLSSYELGLALPALVPSPESPFGKGRGTQQVVQRRPRWAQSLVADHPFQTGSEAHRSAGGADAGAAPVPPCELRPSDAVAG